MAPGQLQLFDVRNDIGKTREVSTENGDAVQRLTALADVAQLKLGDIDRPGRERRPAERVANPVPLLNRPQKCQLIVLRADLVVLVRACQPIRDARFSCREPRRFFGIEWDWPTAAQMAWLAGHNGMFSGGS